MIFDALFVKALFGAGLLLLLIGIWAAQRSRHPFDIRDALMDGATGKASLNALILVTFAALSAWVVIDRENDGKDDVGGILATVLGIFVGGRVVAQGISAFKPVEPGSHVEQTTVRKETVTTVEPDPPPVVAKKGKR